ncbi:MAG: 16S rRNA (adenine(1518)-N(6)/adenine(1519)-N(6))-dimethyltransferase RsmA [Candidatus Tectimicrobiota bacterium]
MPKSSAAHRKGLGQVFLRDRLVVERILESAAVQPQETVLEIGPGAGVLTAGLAQRAGALYAIEIDAHYAQQLQHRFSHAGQVHIAQADARFYDYGSLPHPLVVVSNLPYSMGMAILTHLLRFRQHLSRAIIMLQKEVALRLLAAPASSAYGALSVFFQYYTTLTANFEVTRQAFTPVPAVDSMVVTLVPYAVLPWPSQDEAWLFRLVKCAFAHRRKTLRANLLAAFPRLLERETLAQIFAALDLGAQVRAQEVSVAQFVRLAAALETLRGPRPQPGSSA